MLVIDDALLLLVLAGAAKPRVQEAFETGNVFTTGTWYYRLANALRSRRIEGALSTAFRSLGLLSSASSRPASGSFPQASACSTTGSWSQS